MTRLLQSPQTPPVSSIITATIQASSPHDILVEWGSLTLALSRSDQLRVKSRRALAHGPFITHHRQTKRAVRPQSVQSSPGRFDIVTLEGIPE